MALSAFPYSATARTIRPLPFELGRFAKEANETAEKASSTGDSRASDLMRGRRKSKAPLDSVVRGVRQKFVIKKHGAWSSTGTERGPEIPLFQLLVGKTVMSISSSDDCGPRKPPLGTLPKVASSLLSAFFVSSPRFALRSVALVSLRNTMSKSSLYPGHCRLDF